MSYGNCGGCDKYTKIRGGHGLCSDCEDQATIRDLQDEVTALRAALAAATAREEAPLPAGLATVEALLDYIQSAGVEQPDPIRQRLHAALAVHTERVVRWCLANPLRWTVPPADPDAAWPAPPVLESEDAYLARALAAAKGGA